MGIEKKSGAKNFTMAVAVRLSGIEAYRIRRFEDIGLLSPKRTNGNQRMFSEDDIEVIKEAAKLEDEGINLEGVKAIMAMRRGERH